MINENQYLCYPPEAIHAPAYFPYPGFYLVMTTLRNISPLKSVLVIFLFVTALQTSGQNKKAKTLCIAFYNIENLFDTIDDPRTDDAEFLPDGAYNWTRERYRAKLSTMAGVIAGIGSEITKDSPSVIGLSEIENRGVLEDLINTPPLKGKGYKIVHYDSPDARGVDVALIYKSSVFKVKNSTSNRLTMPGQTDWYTRDQLVVTGKLDGERVSMIVNHWPSRRSGPEYRAAAAKLSRHLSDSLSRKHKNARILIMGDLNDDPADSSVLKVLGAKGVVTGLQKGDLFNPMWQMLNDGTGSLQYRGVWNLFDQIIISEPLLNAERGWKFMKAGVYNEKFLVEQEGKFAGYPFRTYAGKKYLGGFSDHFPTYLILVKER